LLKNSQDFNTINNVVFSDDKALWIANTGNRNFENTGKNQFKLYTESNTLNWTYDACFYNDVF